MSAATGSSGRERVPVLDGLRGVAIALVLFFHTTFVGSQTAPEALLHGLFRNFGWTGVDLFFVLSGYLITGILWDTRGRSHWLRNFYARRALRILPVYYAFLILASVFAPRISPELWTVGDDAIFYWIYLQNVAIASAGDWTHSRFLNLFWSLAVEEHFYLIWPWVVGWLADRRRLMQVAVGALVFSLAARCVLVALETAPVAVYVLTPTRLDGLAAGSFVALAMRGPRGLAGLLPGAWAVGGGAAFGILGLVYLQRGFSYMLPGTATLGLTLVALLFAAALVVTLAAPQGTRWARLLSSRALRALGRWSYTLYVVHQVAFVFVTWALVRFVVEPHAPWLGTLGLQLLVYPTAIGLAVAIAAASWRFFERPILRWKTRFV